MTSDTKTLSPAERMALIPTIAVRRFEGLGEQPIAELLKISRRQVRNILQSKEYEEYLKELQETAIKTALAGFRSSLEGMIPLAVEALRKNLKEGRIESVKLWAQLVGGLKDSVNPEQQQAIQIVLPEGLIGNPTQSGAIEVTDTYSSVKAGLAQSAAGETISRGSFSQYTEDKENE